MKCIASGIVNQMFINGLIENGEKELYTYHLLMLIEKTVAYLALLILAIWFNVFIHTILFLFFFANIRKHSGGFHLTRFYSCFISSIGLYIILVKEIYPFLNKHIEVIVILLMFAIMIILYIGAVNNENINWNRREFVKNRQIARCMGIIEIFIIVISGLLNMNRSYLIYMSFGVIVSAFLLLIEKIRKVNEISL